MITAPLQQEAAEISMLLDGIADVYMDPPKALQSLAAARPVAILTDPDITLQTWEQAEYRFEIWLAVPGHDEQNAREFFDRALAALVPLGFSSAYPQMLTQSQGRSYLAYQVTYTTTYTI